MVLSNKLNPNLSIAIVVVLGMALVIMLQFVYPTGVDWEETFSKIPGHFQNPYEIETFKNPPWVVFMLPHAWLPIRWGNAINYTLNLLMIMLIIWKFKGNWKTMLLVFTSPLILDLARTNNVDWIPLLAFLLPAQWGLPLLALKPQTLGGAALIWLKRANFRWTVLVPTLMVLVASLFIWGFWFLRPTMPNQVPWNFSVFPFGIPLGVYMLYRAYHADDEILAAASTPFFMPYFAPYSLAALLALVGCKYRKEAFFVYVAFWCYAIVELRRISLQ